MNLTLPAGNFAARASPDLRFQRYRPDGNFDTTRHLTWVGIALDLLAGYIDVGPRRNAFSSLTARSFANLCISLGFKARPVATEYSVNHGRFCALRCWQTHARLW